MVFFSVSGFLWYIQVKLPPTVHLLQDKGKLMDFLLRRRDCKMVILSVCAQSASMATKCEFTVMRQDRAELGLLFFLFFPQFWRETRDGSLWWRPCLTNSTRCTKSTWRRSRATLR